MIYRLAKMDFSLLLTLRKVRGTNILYYVCKRHYSMILNDSLK